MPDDTPRVPWWKTKEVGLVLVTAIVTTVFSPATQVLSSYLVRRQQAPVNAIALARDHAVELWDALAPARKASRRAVLFVGIHGKPVPEVLGEKALALDEDVTIRKARVRRLAFQVDAISGEPPLTPLVLKALECQEDEASYKYVGPVNPKRKLRPGEPTKAPLLNSKLEATFDPDKVNATDEAWDELESAVERTVRNLEARLAERPPLERATFSPRQGSD